jgi:hypothetical protein
VERVIHFEKAMIAPCGINCGTCIAFLREGKNRCPGCRYEAPGKPKTRTGCKIKTCEYLPDKASAFCSDCHLFPCARIKHIDKRYRTRYKTSLISNLAGIKEKGIISFLKSEGEKWKCQVCGAVLSVHRENCLKCGAVLKRELPRVDFF